MGSEDKTTADPRGCVLPSQRMRGTMVSSPLVTLCLMFGNSVLLRTPSLELIECTRDECSVPGAGVSMWPAWEGRRTFLTQLCSCCGPQGSQGDMQRGAEPRSAGGQGLRGAGGTAAGQWDRGRAVLPPLSARCLSPVPPWTRRGQHCAHRGVGPASAHSPSPPHQVPLQYVLSCSASVFSDLLQVLFPSAQLLLHYSD